MRSQKHRSGLDYTKTVIISNMEYVESKGALLDKDEYNETIINVKRIKREALQFVEDYVVHATGKKMLQEQGLRRRYHYSPLRYFHKELKIEE